MRYLARDSHFAMKARQRGAVTDKVLRQKFERDCLAQLEIVGTINFTHAAFAQQPDDTIATGKIVPETKRASSIVSKDEARAGVTFGVSSLRVRSSCIAAQLTQTC